MTLLRLPTLLPRTAPAATTPPARPAAWPASRWPCLGRLVPATAARVMALCLTGAMAGCGGGGGDTQELQAPALLIRSAATGEVRGAFDVQFFFSAPVGFPSGRLPFSLSGGSEVPGSLSPLTSDTWQVRLTPNPNQEGLVELEVPAGAFTDAAGGPSNGVAYAFAQPFNTLAPFATLSFDGPMNALGMITGPGAFTLAFNAVLDAALTAQGVDVTVGSIGGFSRTSAAGQPDAYTFTYTPPAATVGAVTFELGTGVVASGGIPGDRNWWSFGLATP